MNSSLADKSSRWQTQLECEHFPEAVQEVSRIIRCITVQNKIKFLCPLNSSNENIIELIKNGEHDDIGAEKLRGLLKILPEVDELDMLKSFDGDKSRLGKAEKFLFDLMKLSK